MALKTIHCEDCGKPRQTRRSNTKYCYPCRILRNITWIDKQVSKCLVCENPFAPLQRGMEICGKCDPVPPPGDPRGTCALCAAEDASLVDKDVSVCRGCATDPEKRGIFRAALIKKQARA